MRVARLFALVSLLVFSIGAYAAATPAALTGTVTSAEEGAMEGVLVTVRRAGSNMNVTVVSDAQGRYAFPADRLESGNYALRIRAAGYDLAGETNPQVAS